MERIYWVRITFDNERQFDEWLDRNEKRVSEWQIQ